MVNFGFGLGFTFPQGRDGQNGAMPSARTNQFRISKIIASVYGQVIETFFQYRILYLANGSTGGQYTCSSGLVDYYLQFITAYIHID